MPDNLVGGLVLAIIDMSVVFLVLFGLALLIRAISAFARRAEGTRRGRSRPGATHADKVSAEAEVGVEAAGFAAESAVEAPPETVLSAAAEEAVPLTAVVASAISAYVEDVSRETRVRPTAPAAAWAVLQGARGHSSAWSLAGRLWLLEGRESFGRFKHGEKV